MRFAEPWAATRHPQRGIVWRPTLRLVLPETEDAEPRDFLVDSGADTSLAPGSLCDSAGKQWGTGEKRILRGLNTKDECAVEARVHSVELLVPHLDLTVAVPMAFAEGEAPLLLGREGFFEYFRVTFDRPALMTHFEFVGPIE